MLIAICAHGLYSLLLHEPAVQTVRGVALLVGAKASCCNILVLEQARTQLFLLREITQPEGPLMGC